MHPKAPKWLDDIKLASAHIVDRTADLALPDYAEQLL